ncbi:MAG: RusA family crossover junction endodeoxyribonuclease [Rhodospirillales bacterium]
MNPPAEFCVHGTPVSLSARSAGKWQTAVATSARRAIPYLTPPHTEAVTVVLAYFYFNNPGNIIDVDNMAKTILDALENVIFENDRQVQQLHVRRTDVEDIPDRKLAGASGVLANALEGALLKETNFVYIRIEGPPDHGSAP